MGTPSEEARSHRPSRQFPSWVYALAVLAVVVAASLTSVLSVGLSQGTRGATSEQAALQAAAPLANGIPGGPWQLLSVDGFIGEGPLNALALLRLPSPFGERCSVIRNGTVNTTSVPTYEGPYFSGLAATWVFIYANSSGTALGVLVQKGVAALIGEEAGCWTVLPPLGGDLIDSTEAALVLFSTPYGSGFLSAHSTGPATYSLEGYPYREPGGTIAFAPIWYVVAGTLPNGPLILGEVYATNGTMVCTPGTAPCLVVTYSFE